MDTALYFILKQHNFEAKNEHTDQSKDIEIIYFPDTSVKYCYSTIIGLQSILKHWFLKFLRHVEDKKTVYTWDTLWCLFTTEDYTVCNRI